MAGKRKSDASASSSNAKKRKAKEVDHSSAKAVLSAANADFKDCNPAVDFADESAVRQAFKDVANYMRSLENEIKELKTRAANGLKSREQIEDEADRLADNVVRGISRLLTWKPSCKHNDAKFVYDGLCADPLVFGAMFGLEGPPKFKQKKMLGSELEKIMGTDIIGSAMYNYLYISQEQINIRYNAETGEFKISGRYCIKCSKDTH